MLTNRVKNLKSLRRLWYLKEKAEAVERKVSLKLKYLVLFHLYIVRTYAGISFHAVREVPMELVQNHGSAGSSLVGKFDFSKLVLTPQSDNAFAVELEGSRPIFEAGFPALPHLNRKIAVPQGYRAEVTITDLVLEESDTPVPLKKIPEPHVWGPKDRTFSFAKKGDGYFPGEIVRARPTRDGLSIAIFPAQYHSKTEKLSVIRSFKMWVSYRWDALKPAPPRDLRLAPSLIVTSETLKNSAEKLRAFHKEKQGVQSDIVFVEDIEKNTEPLDENELPDGYKNAASDSEVIPWDPKTKEGYNYGLARKIAQFIRARAARTVDFRYVTLLGNGSLIPPSYYFSLPSTFSLKWGVTDQCYAAEEKCLHPKWALGRLPFRTDAEVMSYLEKASRYLRQRGKSPSELALLGGKAFPNSDVYEGELGALEPIQSLKSDWYGVEKYFRTKKNYSKDLFLKLVRGEWDSQFVYSLDHGTGDRWYLEHDFVSSKEITETPAIAEPSTPILVSISCINGAFDEKLVREEIFRGDQTKNESIGVSLLKSKGGAVAYFGSTRVALGNAVYDFDRFGNLNYKGTDYGLSLLAAFFEKYGESRRGRLGDFVLAAQTEYVSERGNNMKSPEHAWSYYIATLLGDPVLSLPEREKSEEGFALASSLANLGDTLLGMPKVTVTFPKHFALDLKSDSSVTATLFHWLEDLFGNFEGEEQVEELRLAQGAFQIDHLFAGESASGAYFLRLENEVGVPRERQVWFRVNAPQN